MAEDIDCYDCKYCEIIDEIYGIFQCNAYHMVTSGGACHDCEKYEEMSQQN